MSVGLTSLNMVAYTWTPNAGGSPPAVVELARLKTFGFTVENDQVDAGGVANRYGLNMNVKQGQTLDFTVFLKKVTGLPVLTNLDISLWDLPSGTHFLGSLRSGTIEVTTSYKEGSGIADAYKFPVATRTQTQVTTDKLVITDVAFVGALMTNAVATFDVVATITFDGTTYVQPMTIKSAKHTVDRDEMQMENVVMTSKGTPTGPSDNSLLGNVLLGTGQVALTTDTGGGKYATGAAQWALITKLTTKFSDASPIEQTGQFMIQGGATYTAD